MIALGMSEQDTIWACIEGLDGIDGLGNADSIQDWRPCSTSLDPLLQNEFWHQQTRLESIDCPSHDVGTLQEISSNRQLRSSMRSQKEVKWIGGSNGSPAVRNNGILHPSEHITAGASPLVASSNLSSIVSSTISLLLRSSTLLLLRLRRRERDLFLTEGLLITSTGTI